MAIHESTKCTWWRGCSWLAVKSWNNLPVAQPARGSSMDLGHARCLFQTSTLISQGLETINRREGSTPAVPLRPVAPARRTRTCTHNYADNAREHLRKRLVL
eukprot:361633-Chlamydomonas_euryale.AAC.3